LNLQEGGCSNDPATKSALFWAELRFNQLSATSDSSSQIQQLSPTALAYLGDAVYELYIRACFLLPPKRSQSYHHQVVSQVRAETQADHLRSLEHHLTTKELEIIRRGRNAASGCPKRLDPKIYQQATSFEALIGYLYLTDTQRLTELLALLQLDSNPATASIKT
jgi:ribonuclease-3 family protein